MPSDAKPSVQAKGKAREDSNWQLGWWELYSLAERERSPVVWSKSSVIFSAHPTRPVIIARHFSSSRQFTVPSPPPVNDFPSSYSPPSVISLSPNENWLFAYFPGRDREGAACLWRRLHQLDSWVVFDFWSTAVGSGIVTAEWTGQEREWVIRDMGPPSRHPPKGPVHPVNSNTLLLVTQSQHVNVCFLPPAMSSLKILKAPLTQPTLVSENGPHYVDETSTTWGQRLCVCAGIGLSYSESTILIATRSVLLPPNPTGQDPDDAMNLVLPLEAPFQKEDPHPVDWELWGEESTIEVCELSIETNGIFVGIVTRPLPSVFKSGAPVTSLTFLSVLAQSPALASPAPTKDPRRPQNNPVEKRNSLYLAASFLDSGDYCTSPKSEIALYSFHRKAPASQLPPPIPRWYVKRETTRSFDSCILAFLVPSASRTGVLAGFLDLSGSGHRTGKTKEVCIGSVIALNLPELTNDDHWESSPIITTSDLAGRDVPGGVAVSPNYTLLCSVLPPIQGSRTSVYPLPKRNLPNMSMMLFPPPTSPRSELSKALCTAIYGRRSPSDVIHSLTLSTTSYLLVVNALYGSLSILEANTFGLPEIWMDEMLGVITEVYLGRAQNTEASEMKDLLNAKWKAAHNLCSVAALCSAFANCKDNDVYDLEAVWQLVGLCVWLMDFLEELMKECVFANDCVPPQRSQDPRTNPEDVLSASPTPFGSPIFIHLTHPYAVKCLQIALTHVKGFRDYLGDLAPRAENAQIAKDVLLDSVDSSGIDLNALVPLFDEFIENAAKLNADELRKSVAVVSPLPPLIPHLRQTIEKILSSKVIDKPKLFIKASDLVDGVSRMTLADRLEPNDTDVVTKGMLSHRGAGFVCVRCGGQSEIGGEEKVAGHFSLRWHAWEKIWATRCVCGGGWTLHS